MDAQVAIIGNGRTDWALGGLVLLVGLVTLAAVYKLVKFGMAWGRSTKDERTITGWQDLEDEEQRCLLQELTVTVTRAGERFHPHRCHNTRVWGSRDLTVCHTCLQWRVGQ